MISQGTDDVSRGELTSGVMRGGATLSFIPLHLSAIERCRNLFNWIQTWLGQDAILLSPEDWFEAGQDISGWSISETGIEYPKIKVGKWVWAPPPGAGAVAVDLLRLARLKR